MTQRLPTAVARKDFANVLRDSAAGERIKLTRYNKTVAIIIPPKDLAELEDCHKRRAAEASRDQAKSAQAKSAKVGRASSEQAQPTVEE